MKQISDRKKYYFECECTSLEHELVIQFDLEDKEAYIFTQLSNNKNFFKRLWLGLKYIFGYKSPYGNWSETSLNLDKVEELQKLLLRFEVQCKTGK